MRCSLVAHSVEVDHDFLPRATRLRCTPSRSSSPAATGQCAREAMGACPCQAGRVLCGALGSPEVMQGHMSTPSSGRCFLWAHGTASVRTASWHSLGGAGGGRSPHRYDTPLPWVPDSTAGGSMGGEAELPTLIRPCDPRGSGRVHGAWSAGRRPQRRRWWAASRLCGSCLRPRRPPWPGQGRRG